jgi:hypothetical protein
MTLCSSSSSWLRSANYNLKFMKLDSSTLLRLPRDISLEPKGMRTASSNPTPSARHGRNDLNCHGYLQRCVPCPTFGPSSGVSLTPAIRNAR